MRKYYGKVQQRLTIEEKMNELYLRTDFSSTRFDLRKSMSNTKQIDIMLKEIKENQRKEAPGEKGYMKGLKKDVAKDAEDGRMKRISQGKVGKRQKSKKKEVDAEEVELVSPEGRAEGKRSKLMDQVVARMLMADLRRQKEEASLRDGGAVSPTSTTSTE